MGFGGRKRGSWRTRVAVGVAACAFALACVWALVYPTGALPPMLALVPADQDQPAAAASSASAPPEREQGQAQSSLPGDAAAPAQAAPMQQAVELPERISLVDDEDVVPVDVACKPDTVLLRLGQAVSAEAVNDLLARADFVQTKDVSDQDLSLGFAEVALAPGTDIARAVQTLAEYGVVEGAQPDYAYHLLDTDLAAAEAATASVNDPGAKSQWALEYVHAFDAWGLAKAEGAVTVAVVDDGCITQHEDLKDNIVATYNAVTGSTDVPHARTNYYHGTHVAGIVSATSNNAKGVSGVSYNAGILPIQVFQAKNGGADENAYSSTISKAYSYLMGVASRYNIRVVNLSVGGELSSYGSQDKLLAQDIAKAYEQGIVSVCAAGNKDSNASAYKCFPADYCDEAVVVMNLKQDASASDGSGVSLAATSNYNRAGETTKDIAAPGTGIYSTFGNSTADYGYLSGTSMATPLVSGILALEFAANPDLSAVDAVAALYKGATDLGKEGWDETTGYGMADAFGALQALDASIAGPEVCGVGETVQMQPTKYRGAAWKWESSDQGVAQVDSAGKVTGVSAGTATITATFGQATAEKTVIVHEENLSGGASLLAAGGSTEFALSTNLPSGAWTLESSNANIATAGFLYGNDSRVVVRGQSAGKATITARNVAYGVEVSVDVQVFEASIVNVDDPDVGLNMIKGDSVSVKLDGQPQPSGAVWSWASSDESVCTVRVDPSDSTRAKVIGKGAGPAQVTATLAGADRFAVSALANVRIHEINDQTTIVEFASRDTFTYSPSATGAQQEIRPNVRVSYLNDETQEFEELDSRYYRTEYKNNVNAGTATVIVSGRAGYGYAGSVSASFTIKPRSVDKVGIPDIAVQTYTGRAIEPGVVPCETFSVWPGGTVSRMLSQGEDGDYTLAYRNNVNAGTAQVVITGHGNYTGTVTRSFTIAPAPISSASFADIAPQSYTGAELKPGVRASFGGRTLSAGADYSVAYSNNRSAGKAAVVVRGMGNFTGTTKRQFEIVPASLSAATMSVVASQAYTGVAVQPLPQVVWGGRQLVHNVDYVLGYSNNVKAGTAVVTARGVGNFSGSKARTFRIVAPSVKYRTRLQGASWQAYVKDGKATSTKAFSKRSARVRSVSAKLAVKPCSGSLVYRVRARGAWQAWKKDGVAANVGTGKLTTGLQMKLTGTMAKYYDVRYRVKVDGKWMSWARNGATAAKSKSACIQALQIKVVPKS